MHKYVEIGKVYMKSQLVWRVDVMFQMIFTIVKIMFAYLLWSLIFQDNHKIMGFTFGTMMSYYIISSFLTQLEMSQRISEEVNRGIRNGTFSKYMVMPVNIQGYFLAMEMGLILFYLLFVLLAGGIWTVIFQIPLSFTKEKVIWLFAMLLVILGMIFMAQLNYFLGLLTLKYEGIDIFLMIKNNILELMTGGLVPLILFPKEILGWMKFFPFYYVTYLPSMLLVGRCKEEAFYGVGILLLWCVFLQILLQTTWKKYIRKYDGVGI